jgi:HK97 family phage major capsid protein
MSLRLNKVYALVPVTDELAEDAPALDSYIRRRAPEAIDFAINLAIVQGTGTTQPLGILNSPATVSVAKEGSQLADTIVANNINKMWARMYAPHRRNAVWLVNQSIETELDTLSMPGRDNTGAAVTTWGTHVYIPPGGISGSPYGTLKGRPVIPTQATNELGDKGDIILADLSAYLTAIKSGANPKVDVSIHLWFDYDVTAYRFVLRMTGQPWWDLPITPRDGSNTLSPFVTLDERG